jgi:hypothetical protein
MLRLVALLAVGAGVLALLGPRRLRWIFWTLAALALLYTVLKLTGVIDAAFPSRTGV